MSDITNVSSQSEDALRFESTRCNQRLLHQNQDFGYHKRIVFDKLQRRGIGTKNTGNGTDANVKEVRLGSNHHRQLEVQIHLVFHIRLQFHLLILARSNRTGRRVRMNHTLSGRRGLDLVLHLHRLVVRNHDFIASFSSFGICSCSKGEFQRVLRELHDTETNTHTRRAQTAEQRESRDHAITQTHRREGRSVSNDISEAG